MSDYAEKLRDPRWQKKRLEILDRSGFKCEDCGAQTKELHVHHCIYAKGREPWEYSSNSLIAVCAGCHKSRNELETECHRGLAIVLRFSTPEQVTGWCKWLHMLGKSDPKYVPPPPDPTIFES